jgi:putative SOS response-associated peptidase YedK
MTTEPNGIVEPIHEKAMPVMLMTPGDVSRWLNGSVKETLELQKPAEDDQVVIVERRRRHRAVDGCRVPPAAPRVRMCERPQHSQPLLDGNRRQ